MVQLPKALKPKVFNGYYTYHMIRNSSDSFVPDFNFPCRLVSRQTDEKLTGHKNFSSD